jgi:hypothetical protein
MTVSAERLRSAGCPPSWARLVDHDHATLGRLNPYPEDRWPISNPTEPTSPPEALQASLRCEPTCQPTSGAGLTRVQSRGGAVLGRAHFGRSGLFGRRQEPPPGCNPGLWLLRRWIHRFGRTGQFGRTGDFARTARHRLPAALAATLPPPSFPAINRGPVSPAKDTTQE